MKTMIAERLSFVAMVMLVFLTAGFAHAAEPIVTDSRIKTFVYNENDVYNILTHYGYQSNIEFGKKETIRTISIGDRVGWQIVPAGRRLFIRALEEGAHTNMTVVTNKRAYQFDLRASDGDNLPETHELVYVARFYYPDIDNNTPMPPIFSDKVSALPAPRSMMPAAVQPVRAAPIARVSSTPNFNYNYTYAGPNNAAPVKIFDDGTYTFFKFSPNMQAIPQFFATTPQGQEIPVPHRLTPDGFAVVSKIATGFTLRGASGTVRVFNEQQGG